MASAAEENGQQDDSEYEPGNPIDWWFGRIFLALCICLSHGLIVFWWWLGYFQ